jgi:transposase
VRLRAAEMFEHDAGARQVASALRVSTKSVYHWRRAWQAGGEAALASKDAGGSRCKLDEEQIAQLRAVLEADPRAYGWAQDQRWTLARVAAMVMRLFGVSCTLCGISFLLHRLGFSPQVPAHRAFERDEDAVAVWRSAPGRGHEAGGADRRVDLLRRRGRPGAAARPGRSAWAPRGNTPVVRVSGNTGRLSVAGMACMKAGRPGRFFYQVHVHRRRKGDRPSMSEADYADLITAAHRTLGAPVILIWDNLNTHRSKKTRAFTEAREGWLTVVRLPGYAPDLNAVEGAWSVMKSGLGNHAATLDQLAVMVRGRLRSIQRRPELISALLARPNRTAVDPAFQPLYSYCQRNLHWDHIRAN